MIELVVLFGLVVVAGCLYTGYILGHIEGYKDGQWDEFQRHTRNPPRKRGTVAYWHDEYGRSS